MSLALVGLVEALTPLVLLALAGLVECFAQSYCYWPRLAKKRGNMIVEMLCLLAKVGPVTAIAWRHVCVKRHCPGRACVWSWRLCLSFGVNLPAALGTCKTKCKSMWIVVSLRLLERQTSRRLQLRERNVMCK